MKPRERIMAALEHRGPRFEIWIDVAWEELGPGDITSIRVLFKSDLEAVRAEVDRCLEEGAAGGGYVLATCNSIFEGMNPLAVAEMFRYEREVGFP